MDALSVHEAALTHLSLNAVAPSGHSGGTSARLMLNNACADALAQIIPRMEEVDLSGQVRQSAFGSACAILLRVLPRFANFYLRHSYAVLTKFELSDPAFAKVEIGADGWTGVCNGLRMCNERFGGVSLRALVLSGCRVRGESRNMVEDTAARCQHVPEGHFHLNPAATATAAAAAAAAASSAGAGAAAGR